FRPIRLESFTRVSHASGPVALAVLSLVLAAACATPVGVDPVSPQDFQRQETVNAISSGVPSAFSGQVLQRFNLRDRFEDDPGAALAELHRSLDTEDGENRIFALAELSYVHAEQSGARPHYLAAAVYAYAFLFRGAEAPSDPLDPRTRLAAEIYNRALTEGLTPPDGADVVIAPGERLVPFGRLDLALPGGEPAWAGYRLVEFRPASHVKVRGLRNRYRRAGLGAPLMASFAPIPGARTESPLVPPPLKVPVTVFLRLDHVREGLATGQLQGALEVYSMDAASEIVVEGRPVPLEFEPSAALAYTLDRAPVWDSEIRAFLRGSFLQGGGALYAMTPYRAGRVPVVLVHGTVSSPARWADLVNELQADPRIASRIQLWLFTYNTGLPILYSAGLFRELLAKTVAELDPQGIDPALRRMVLIGHSQGGLLAKLAVVDSGTRFWDNVSETPFEALRVSDETRAILRRSMFVTPLPFVSRVVFVATPQRGSDVAGFLEQRLRWLVAWALTLPPSLIRATGEVLVGSEDPLLRRQLRQGLPRSVDNMSPGNQAIQTLAELPIAPAVTAHSVIALKAGGSLGEGGDGVVSYRSAHLDEAASELIVQSGHSVQSHPEAIEEIRRILLQHLGRAGPATGG
ncbi:MAG: esterase/lipase family protein, partial [Candidatus Rokuibacteriota bacterium]